MAKTWAEVIWREYKNCDDRQYALRLYKALDGISTYRFKNSPRPYLAEVEAALRRGCREHPEAEDVWQRRLHRLEREKQNNTPLEELVANLNHEHWLERFLTRHVLLYRGGATVTALKEVIESRRGYARNAARWVLKSIGAETTSWYAGYTETYLCPDCLIHFARLELSILGESPISYYGCRACGQAEEFLNWSGEIVAVLDQHMAERQSEQNVQLRVNWLQHRESFDFDRVEIVQATDEDVERFAVQVGNDMDEIRQSRYDEMQCLVNSTCGLSKNTLRILQHTFGQVEQYAPIP